MNSNCVDAAARGIDSEAIVDGEFSGPQPRTARASSVSSVAPRGASQSASTSGSPHEGSVHDLPGALAAHAPGEERGSPSARAGDTAQQQQRQLIDDDDQSNHRGAARRGRSALVTPTGVAPLTTTLDGTPGPVVRLDLEAGRSLRAQRRPDPRRRLVPVDEGGSSTPPVDPGRAFPADAGGPSTPPIAAAVRPFAAPARRSDPVADGGPSTPSLDPVRPLVTPAHRPTPADAGGPSTPPIAPPLALAPDDTPGPVARLELDAGRSIRDHRCWSNCRATIQADITPILLAATCIGDASHARHAGPRRRTFASPTLVSSPGRETDRAVSGFNGYDSSPGSGPPSGGRASTPRGWGTVPSHRVHPGAAMRPRRTTLQRPEPTSRWIRPLLY
jgi:hypothetical protein